MKMEKPIGQFVRFASEDLIATSGVHEVTNADKYYDYYVYLTCPQGYDVNHMYVTTSGYGSPIEGKGKGEGEWYFFGNEYKKSSSYPGTYRVGGTNTGSFAEAPLKDHWYYDDGGTWVLCGDGK